MAFTMEPNAITNAFRTAGYDDVNFSDVVLARRDDARAWEVVIDRGGRLKATITMPGNAVTPNCDRKNASRIALAATWLAIRAVTPNVAATIVESMRSSLIIALFPRSQSPCRYDGHRLGPFLQCS